MTWLTPRTHPIRFLLYLEWSLLLTVAVSEALQRWPVSVPRTPVLNLFCLVGLTALGLALPQHKRGVKVAHALAELGLILCGILVGGIRLFPFLFVVLATRNCLVFRGWLSWVATGITYGLYLITQTIRFDTMSQNPDPPGRFLTEQLLVPELFDFLRFIFAVLFALVLLFSHLSITAILAEHRRRQELAIANQKLRIYALKAEDIATLKERNRVAREIHDSLGHSLTTFNLHLEAALRLFTSEPEEAQELVQEAQHLAKNALTDVRQSVAALRSDPIAGQTLPEAVQSLVEEFQRSTTTAINPQIQLTTPLPKEVKTAAYRLIQESLTNIRKYAEATVVKLVVKTTPHLQVIVADDGKGFNLSENTTGFGLQGMRERVKALGGQLQIITAPGQGCKIVAKFPLV